MNIQKTLFIIAIVYIVITLARLVASNQGFLWRPLIVSHSRLITGAKNSDIFNIPANIPLEKQKFTCSLACHQSAWCNVWCPDPSSTTSCLFFDMYVVLGYDETNQNDALNCYTRTPFDHAVGASIVAENQYSVYPQRVKENLVDGIYDIGDMDQCYATSDHYNPWLKLDLGYVRPIRNFKMVMQRTDAAVYMYDVEVRAGIIDAPEANFALNKLLGYFPGPATPDEEINFEHDPPILARYVTVQRWSDSALCPPPNGDISWVCRMQICHLEIHG